MSQYNRSNPFFASISDRFNLCKNGSTKETHHIVLDLKGSNLSYQVGDSIGILPDNDEELVQKTIDSIHAKGDEQIVDGRTQKTYTLREYLTTQVDLGDVSRKLVREVTNRQANPEKKEFLLSLQTENNHKMLKEYVAQYHIWDFLIAQDVFFTPQELCSLLMPLLPRLYSISSSQKVVGEEVHLTVALLKYESNGYIRTGICSYFLCYLAPLQRPVVPVYIQSHHGFTLPDDPHRPIIMIGPGTGIAPFRAFLQERIHRGDTGNNWLFFGERNRATDFFYESFWQDLVQAKRLRLDLAFSRDQMHKVYVQHRMLENGAELFKWLEAGAILYVCGDAKNMAKDVEAALLEIIKVHGKRTDQEATAYIKQLRTDKRYLRDVY